jgi:hypothetical protein
MTTTQDENRDVTQSQYFDPFPQPQTIPSGWDMSTLLSTPTIDSVQQADDLAENNSVVE